MLDARALTAKTKGNPDSWADVKQRLPLLIRMLDLTAMNTPKANAQAAGMSKQAMGDLVDQCAAWDLVRREPDPLDARARRVCFTPTGLAWLQAFRDAVAQAEAEFRAAVGGDVATVVAIGLESYASESEFLNEA